MSPTAPQRFWSLTLALLAAGLLAGGTPRRTAGDASGADGGVLRPSFLVILTDDQRWDALGVVQREQGDRGRFPWFRTPNLDRLAAGGVRFRNAFVVNSLCAPSRACFLTGRYNHLNGVANNQTPFPPANVTHATLLRKAGYTTGYFGKWHHDGQRETARPVPNMEAGPPYKVDRARPGANPQAGDAQLNYFRTVSAVDDNVGRLLDALDELKISGHTLVVFASDNGYYLGEHTLGDKRSAYEESIRIPLLARLPTSAGQGKVVDEMALNIDLAPTLLDYAGVEAPPEMQGRSLRPLLEGKPREPWRKAFFYEYFLERRFNVPTTLAVRTTDAKLIRYPGHDDWTELYDLRADSYETKNLARDPAHAELLGQMQQEFDRQAKRVDFKVPDYAHERMPAPPATRPRRR